MPLEFIIGQLCEAFHCLPSAAWREWQAAPVGFLETILDYRAYARAKAVYDARGRTSRDPPLMDTVMEHDFALVQESRDHR